MLSAPRQLLQSGVRAVETITASVIVCSSLEQGCPEKGLNVLQRLQLCGVVRRYARAVLHALALHDLESVLGRLDALAARRDRAAVVLDVEHAVPKVLRPREESLARVHRIA